MGATDSQTARTIRHALDELGLRWHEAVENVFSVTLPGVRKLSTECALQLGAHDLSLRAFVARHPDQDHEQVYRWLLERNLKLYAIRFSVDTLGDIYLTARIARSAVSSDEIDRLLGAVAETADDSFNSILELGFSDSIRREWRWRLDRGESTDNLAAFTHLAPGAEQTATPDAGKADAGAPAQETGAGGRRVT